MTNVGSKLAIGLNMVQDVTERADGCTTPPFRDPPGRSPEANEDLSEAAAEFIARLRGMDEDLFERVVAGSG